MLVYMYIPCSNTHQTENRTELEQFLSFFLDEKEIEALYDLMFKRFGEAENCYEFEIFWH